MRTERKEDYLEAIEELISKKGSAKQKDLTEMLKLSPSSVTEMLQKLAVSGYINYEKYHDVTLTKNGLKIAIETRNKHEMLSAFLTGLGIEKKLAEEDACKIEHILSKETSKRLSAFVEFMNYSESTPRWLDHFKYFYKTGKFVECTPENHTNCPVHGKKTKN